jgi:hypothetical protein
MSDLNISRSVRPRALDAESTIAHDPGTSFTPGAFFREAGTLIAICLGLGLVARFLLG